MDANFFNIALYSRKNFRYLIKKFEFTHAIKKEFGIALASIAMTNTGQRTK
jgi:hypothetical protein